MSSSTRREDAHRMLAPRVLGIRLDALEVGLGADALDLELRHEHHQVAGRVARERHGALRREEAEVRQVADVVLVEDDVPGQVSLGEVAEQPLAPLGELCRGDAVRVAHGSTILTGRPSPPGEPPRQVTKTERLLRERTPP